MKSYRRRNESPPSSERDSWPISVRVESGQSTKIRLVLIRPAVEPATVRSIVVCGSAPRKCAETVVDGANASVVVVSKATVGVTGSGALTKLKPDGVVVES